MYKIPYNDCDWRVQWFATLDEAERMVAFYLSCGAPAKVMYLEKNESIRYKELRMNHT